MRPLGIALAVVAACAAGSPALAQDTSALYKQLCASCHETGLGRAPTRDVLRQMTSERVLAALESGAMLSMASGRTGAERRAIAEFVTGKPFAEAFSTSRRRRRCAARRGNSPTRLRGPPGTAGA